jgi:hypothetical protein
MPFKCLFAQPFDARTMSGRGFLRTISMCASIWAAFIQGHIGRNKIKYSKNNSTGTPFTHKKIARKNGGFLVSSIHVGSWKGITNIYYNIPIIPIHVMCNMFM